jgi:F-type H+-transporting ATPase subunit gamma
MLSSRPYFETLYETVQSIADVTETDASPYLTKHPDKPVLFVVIAGDRGLAGGYNSNVLKLSLAEMEGKNALVLPLGKKATEYFKSKHYPIFLEQNMEAEDLSASHCFSLAKEMCKAFLSGQIGEVRIAYTNFVSILSQTPATLQALPLLRQDTTAPRADGQVTYEPDSETVLRTIIPEYLGGILYGALCESRAAEQAARRTAMDAATQNADDMIADLNLKYNQARQAAITQEITEIVAGSQ